MASSNQPPNEPPRASYVPPARPLGITIIGALEVIAGIIGIITAGIVFLAAGFAGVVSGGFVGGVVGFFAGLVLGGISLIIALVTLAVGIGLLRGRGWAWKIAVIISVINIIIALFDFAGASVRSLSLGFLGRDFFGAIGTFIISLIVLVYLYRPHVKAFFHKI